jgi:hypothetical protein
VPILEPPEDLRRGVPVPIVLPHTDHRGLGCYGIEPRGASRTRRTVMTDLEHVGVDIGPTQRSLHREPRVTGEESVEAPISNP